MAWGRSFAWLAWLVGLACSVAGCGGHAAAPQALRAPIASAIAPALRAAPAAVDLTQVADPPRLVVSGRLSRPGASLDVLRTWTQLPMLQPDDLAELAVGEGLAPFVDLEAAVDFAVSVRGEHMEMRPLVAVSVGLKDADASKAALAEKYALTPAPNGVLLIRSPGEGSAQGDGNDDGQDTPSEDRACEIAPAYGTPATRLVCAEDAKALGELGPWLTRTAARTSGPGDLDVQVRMLPLRATLTAFRRTTSMLVAGLLGGAAPQGERTAALDCVDQLLDFAVDLDDADLTVDLSDSLATARTTLRFAATQSMFTRLVLAHPDVATATPGPFWQLSADSDLAFFERGIDPDDLARGTRWVVAVVDQVLADAGLKSADRKAVVDALAKLPSAAPLAYASGIDADAVDAASRAVKDGPGSRDAGHDLAEALLGWRIAEMAEPSDRVAAAIKALAVAWGRPGVGRVLGTRARAVPPPSLSAQPLPKGAFPGTGATHYVIRVPVAEDGSALPKGKGDPPLALHLIIVPDGSRTWIGMGGDAAGLATRLAAVRSAPDGARTELTPLDHDDVGAGGFLDVRSLPEAVVELATLLGDREPEALAALQSASALPHRGLTPIVFALSSTTEPRPTAVSTLQIPRSAVEDALVLALSRAHP